jgi:hypothetical protein
VVVVPGLVDGISSMSSNEEDFNEQVAQNEEESNENPCLNCVLLATVAWGRERVAASVVAPAQRGKDECHEPEVAEDEMQRCQNASIFGEAWCNRSNKINNHGNDSLREICVRRWQMMDREMTRGRFTMTSIYTS